MGGGTPRAHTSRSPRPENHPRHPPSPVIPAPPSRHSAPPLPSFLRPLSVIPAQAGTPNAPNPRLTSPLPQFIPPPWKGGGEVGGGTPRATHIPPHFPHFPAPSPPAHAPTSCYRTGVPNHAPLPTTPPTRPPPSFLRRQEPNANADQNLTEVDARLTALDARLTKVDKGCQKLTPSTPTPTPNPSKTQQNRNRARHPNTPSVNPRCQPLRHTPNNPEQIRTNLNKPEHRQAPRPDREHPQITPQHPEKKQTPNTAASHSQPPTPQPSFPHPPSFPAHPPSFPAHPPSFPAHPPSFPRPPSVIPAQAGTTALRGGGGERSVKQSARRRRFCARRGCRPCA